MKKTQPKRVKYPNVKRDAKVDRLRDRVTPYADAVMKRYAREGVYQATDARTQRERALAVAGFESGWWQCFHGLAANGLLKTE